MLVDTSVWIDYFNGHKSKEADILNRLIAEGESIHIACLVLTEILLGLRNDAGEEIIANLLTIFDEVADPGRLDYIAAASLYRHGCVRK